MGLGEKEWSDILNKMIFAFEWAMLHEEGKNIDLPEEEAKANWDKFSEGMKLFGEWFMALWW